MSSPTSKPAIDPFFDTLGEDNPRDETVDSSADHSDQLRKEPVDRSVTPSPGARVAEQGARSGLD